MAKETSIKLFENKKVRSVWDAEGETVINCERLKNLTQKN